MSETPAQCVIQDFKQADALTVGPRGRGTMAATLILGIAGLLSVVSPVTFILTTHPRNMPIFNASYMILYAAALTLSVTGLTVGIIHLSLRPRYRMGVLVGIIAAALGSLCATALVMVKLYSYYLLFGMMNELIHGMAQPLN